MIEHKVADSPILDSRYLSGKQLLEALFNPECRPTERWLRTQQKVGAVPSVRIGRLVFYDPIAVKASWAAKRTRGGAR